MAVGLITCGEVEEKQESLLFTSGKGQRRRRPRNIVRHTCLPACPPACLLDGTLPSSLPWLCFVGLLVRWSLVEELAELVDVVEVVEVAELVELVEVAEVVQLVD